MFLKVILFDTALGFELIDYYFSPVICKFKKNQKQSHIQKQLSHKHQPESCQVSAFKNLERHKQNHKHRLKASNPPTITAPHSSTPGLISPNTTPLSELCIAENFKPVGGGGWKNRHCHQRPQDEING